MTEPVISPRAATALIAGMRAVMLVDGRADPRELAVIEAWSARLPEPVDVTGARLVKPEEQRLLARCLLEVAVADGLVTDEERELIREIGRAHGVTEALLVEIEAELHGHHAGAPQP